MRSTERISATPEAIKVIRQLREENGELMFHQSGGCCDGSQPMCFEKGEFKVGSNDIYMGDVDGCGFFMSNDQFEYWKHTKLNMDIVPGRGSSFSLEIPLGLRFIIRSRLFTDEEMNNLRPVITGEEYLYLQMSIKHN
jgi:uncharacterized protein (DUF779 family)